MKWEEKNGFNAFRNCPKYKLDQIYSHSQDKLHVTENPVKTDLASKRTSQRQGTESSGLDLLSGIAGSGFR